MKLLRSWPRQIPVDRSYVMDGTDRLIMDVDYDYRRLAGYRDDILLLEWDLAVEPDQLARFAARCRPDRVRVAPFRLHYQYGDNVWDQKQRPVWAHRRYSDPGRLRWVTDMDQTCHLFAFGCVYLPGELIAQFCRANPSPAGFGDSSFSHWHYEHAEDPEVVIDWDCRPIHLNHPPLREYIDAHPALH